MPRDNREATDDRGPPDGREQTGDHGSTDGQRSTDGTPSTKRRALLKAAGATGATAATALAGCMARGESGPKTVQIAANTEVTEAIDDIQSKLHEVGLSEDVELDPIAGSATSGGRRQQYNRWTSAELAEPSLFMMDSGWTIPFIIREQVANLSELRPEVASTVEDEYHDTFVETAQGESGDLYGVPFFPTTGAMLYRKDLVEEAGFSPEEENWATEALSWSKFSEVVSKTQEETDTKWGFSFQGNTYEGLACCGFKEFTGSWGGSYFGARENLFGPVNERPVTVNSESVRTASKMVRTFIDGDGPNGLDDVEGDISPQAVLQWTEESSREPFTNGDVVAHRNWPYAVLINGAEEEFGEDLGVMPMPYGVQEDEAEFEGYGGTTSSLGGWHVCLNPNSEKQEHALDVMEAMTKPEFQLFLFSELGYLPPRPELYESEEAQDVEVMGRYLDTLKITVENSVPRPVTVAWPQQSTKIAQNAAAAISGDATPKQAMQTLEQQLKRIEEASERDQESSGNRIGRTGDSPRGGR